MADYPASMVPTSEIFQKLCPGSFSAHGCATAQCPHLASYNCLPWAQLVPLMEFLIQMKHSATLNYQYYLNDFPPQLKREGTS